MGNCKEKMSATDWCAATSSVARDEAHLVAVREQGDFALRLPSPHVECIVNTETREGICIVHAADLIAQSGKQG